MIAHSLLLFLLFMGYYFSGRWAGKGNTEEKL